MALDPPGTDTKIRIRPLHRPPRSARGRAAALVTVASLAAGAMAWLSIKRKQPDLTARTRERLARDRVPPNAEDIAG
jgi:hypothetical protein